MKAAEAVELLHRLTFRPGWLITGTTEGVEQPGKEYVLVEFMIMTVDTSFPNVTGRYTIPKMLMPEFKVDVARMTPYLFLDAILRQVHELDVHEDREFLRVRQDDGSWKAPFHPHTPQGELDWLVLRESEDVSRAFLADGKKG